MTTFNFYTKADGSLLRCYNDPSTPLWQRAEAMVETGLWGVIAKGVPEENKKRGNRDQSVMQREVV